MKPIRNPMIVVLLLVAVTVTAAGCGLPPVFVTYESWTPPPLTVAIESTAAEVAAVEPAASDTPAAVEEPSATPTPAPTSSPAIAPKEPTATATGLASAAAAATRRPTATVPRPTKSPTPRPAPTLIPSPTVDRHRMVITEADIANALVGGEAAKQGVKANNLKVRFADGKVNVTADQLSYGAVNVRNLALVGRLVARNGKLELVTESVSPGGLVGALIPTVANQALGQMAANWYVEQVQTLDGRVELKIR